MAMRSRLAAAIAVAAIAAGAVAVPGQAQVGDAVQERLARGAPAVPTLLVKGKKRYRIMVTSALGSVLLQAQRAPARAEYVVPGTGTAKRIKANFGKLGKVNVTFKKKGKARKYRPKGCTGKPAKLQPGVWLGTIRFKGENGYTKVSKKKARGHVVKGGSLSCSESDPGSTRPTVWLWADKDRPQGDLTFEAFKLRDNPSAKPQFRATSFERSGKVKVVRTVSLRGKPGQFTFGLSPFSGTVTPPSPFKGTGTYSGGAWSGNLRVRFPGTSAVALTGSGFNAGMSVVNP